MNGPAITLDIDWAPDSAIDFAAEFLRKHRVRATWFVTHRCAAVERLSEHPDLFELGIHPNFLPGSTHGDTPEKVLEYCMNLVPTGRSMRTHGLVQSTSLLQTVMTQTPIETDVSMLLPRASSLEPFVWARGGRILLRMPYFWADDVEMENGRPSWDLSPLVAGPGLRIFAFHPIHVFLNSMDFQSYGKLKAAVAHLNEATDAAMLPFVHEGVGTRTLFVALVEYLGRTGESLRIRDIHQRWRAST